jgi:ADP-ribosylation factor GTPase-activating protein 2/3
MSYGGNGRARVFFKQHGWTDGGKIEQKYTSRAAELYKQLLNKEVAKSSSAAAAAAAAKPAPVADFDPGFDSPKFANGHSDDKAVAEKDFFLQEETRAAPTPSVAAPRPAVSSVTRKPTSLGARKVTGGKPGGLGLRKTSTKVQRLPKLL